MVKIKTKLLTNKERNVCQKIATLEKGLISKRAVALLTVDDGHTQTIAAKKSGLTIGQVRYALRIFRKNNLILFPADTRENAGHSGSSLLEESAEMKEQKKGKASNPPKDSGKDKQRDAQEKQEPKEKKKSKTKKGKPCKKCKKANKTKQCKKCKKKDAKKIAKKNKKSSKKDKIKKGKKGKKNKKNKKR